MTQWWIKPKICTSGASVTGMENKPREVCNEYRVTEHRWFKNKMKKTILSVIIRNRNIQQSKCKILLKYYKGYINRWKMLMFMIQKHYLEYDNVQIDL